MRFAIATVLVGMTALMVDAAAQTPAPPAVERVVLAGSKLGDLGTEPVSFCALAVTIPANAVSHITAGSNAIVYQLGGSTEITTAGESKTLGPTEATFVPGGHEVSLKAVGDEPSRSLHFMLVRGSVSDSPVATEPAAVAELFRSPGPIPDLKRGAYEINLTRVMFPPRMPANAPHHRSGAALYYILSGAGANTVARKTIENGAGAVVYEPSSLVHQWANPGSEPFTFLAFNINPEGEPAVVPEALTKP